MFVISIYTSPSIGQKSRHGKIKVERQFLAHSAIRQGTTDLVRWG
jgi:hypothetical protein